MTILDEAPTRNGSEHTQTRLSNQAVAEREPARPARSPAMDTDYAEQRQRPIGNQQGADTPQDDETQTEAAELAAAREVAKKFAWGWLIFASAVSILGNGAHSYLINEGKPLAFQIWAVFLALCPPIFLLGSTHLVALLIRARRLGWDFGVTLTVTILVGLTAFLLCFYNLRELVEMMGMRHWTGFYPIIIDLSIVGSTLSLLTLSRPRRVTRQPAEAEQLQELLAGVPVRWEAIAAVAHEQNPGVPAIQERSIEETADILKRIYEHRESVRAVGRVHNKLHHRKINAITDAGAEALKQFRLAAEPVDTAA